MARYLPPDRYAATGPWGKVQYAISANLKAEAEIFLDEEVHKGLGIGTGENIDQGNGDKAKRKFMALFVQMANTGRIPNSSRFSKESGKIYGFKYKQGNKLIRFACFQEGNCWLLTHGFFKPGAKTGKGKWPAEEIKRAQRIMSEHKKLFGI